MKTRVRKDSNWMGGGLAISHRFRFWAGLGSSLEEFLCSITPESGASPQVSFELVLNWRGNFEKLVRGEPPPNQIEKNVRKRKRNCKKAI